MGSFLMMLNGVNVSLKSALCSFVKSAIYPLVSTPIKLNGDLRPKLVFPNESWLFFIQKQEIASSGVNNRSGYCPAATMTQLRDSGMGGRGKS